MQHPLNTSRCVLVLPMRLPRPIALLSGLLGATMAVLGSEAVSADFSQPGPCVPRSMKAQLAVPPELRSLGLPASLPLNATWPASCGAGATPFGSVPFPVLLMYPGFMNRASNYWRLVQQAASWGFVVLQYDTSGLPPSIAAELRLVPALVQWLGDQGDDPSSQLYGQMDLTRLATAGHSRGGKLASLAFTGYPDLVRAAYLVDPVDNTRYSPESAADPSAVKALAASGRAVGVSGAGIVGRCNPAEANFEHFYEAAGNGSWLGRVTGSAHGQFADGGCIINAAADLLCGRGRGVARPGVATLTYTPMLAWLWEQLEGQEAAAGGSATPSPLPAFFGWVEQQEVAGRLDFEVKGEEVAAAWADAADAAAAAPAPGVAIILGGEDEGCGATAPSTSERRR